MTNYKAAAKELSTLRDFIRWITSRFNEAGLFYGHGNDDAFNEATQLVLSALHLPVDALPEQLLDAKLSSVEKDKVLNLTEQRIEHRTPLPYLTNEAWFAGLAFYVDKRVLIPRSPFAELIQSQFQPWLTELPVAPHILDLCTGSACIAIACAMAFDDSIVDAIDISQEALDVAAINVEKHQLHQQVQLIQSDVWQNIPSDRRYDLIVSNPPYVSAQEMTTLPDEYRHEPVLALEAKNNGLAVVEIILSKAADYLTDNGLLFVEVGNTDITVDEAWPEIPFLWLDFEQGGHGIFMLTKKDCLTFQQHYINQA